MASSSHGPEAGFKTVEEEASNRSRTKRKRRDAPKVVKQESVLYQPLRDIIKAVIEHWGYSGSCTIVDTHRKMMEHVSGNGNPAETYRLKSSPDFMVKGSGRNYSTKPFKPSRAAGSDRVDYLRCAAPLEVKTKANRSFKSNLSGVNHSVNVDVYVDPAAFVRFILGVVSPDDEVLCEERFLKTIDEDGNDIIYKPYPIFYHRAIRSRGTCCWKAFDLKTDEIVLIKDAWRASLRKPETDFLQEVKELKLVGVVQMISCQADEDDTVARMRGIVMKTLPSDVTTFRDRTFSRIVFVDGGQPVEYFRSRGDLLYAFRDAIAGHRNLWKAGILHRDGTRAFQSVNILKSYNVKQGKYAPHDHLDDLESFFYILCWICIGYSSPAIKVDPFPAELLEWEDENPRRASWAKDNIFLREFELENPVTDYFGPIFYRLLARLRAFFQPHVIRKRRKAPTNGWPSLTQLQDSESEKDYEAILNIFDEAIAEYEEEEAAATSKQAVLTQNPAIPIPSTSALRSPLSPIFPPQSSQNPFQDGSPLGPMFTGPAPASPGRKRKSESDDEGSPRLKKSRSTYKLPVIPPGSPTTPARWNAKKTPRSTPARPSNLYISSELPALPSYPVLSSLFNTSSSNTHSLFYTLYDYIINIAYDYDYYYYSLCGKCHITE
ncbi:hypothetical protein CPB84DRAFT_1743631 [Gymnopilus junonius]|uniref:Fungal-type protein kinase domain-containing protein n=1 Tax=Gymnopilus junonius TaxID=109634 RepID=A0A9P5TS98_GYMJU|nr:hypothetical protein CPB84DRAFT_1743631 [Gymnopilus junonius]